MNSVHARVPTGSLSKISSLFTAPGVALRIAAHFENPAGSR
jgi:hypothetical protein